MLRATLRLACSVIDPHLIVDDLEHTALNGNPVRAAEPNHSRAEHRDHRARAAAGCRPHRRRAGARTESTSPLEHDPASGDTTDTCSDISPSPAVRLFATTSSIVPAMKNACLRQGVEFALGDPLERCDRVLQLDLPCLQCR